MDHLKKSQILFIDDEAQIRHSIAQSFELAELDYQCFESPVDCLGLINEYFNGIIVSDIRMQPMDGIALLAHVQKIDPQIPVILITGHGDITLAVNALQQGAYDFVEKPYNNNKLINNCIKALEKRELYLKLQILQKQKAEKSLTAIVGDSTPTTKLKQKIAMLAPANVDILLNGATGVGKELVARTIHQKSPRKDKPFVAINCGALPLSIIESELFGHQKGAFTGATENRIGKFEYAHGGTIFLDELESMPMDLQVKLLRVLQERHIERIGSNQLIDLDIRVIAASKKDLLEESKNGNFREDLFYRLNVGIIDIPSLDERKQDIPLLAHYFIEEAAQKHQINIQAIHSGKVQKLMERSWPGNVRELKNFCERIALGIDEYEILSTDPNSQMMPLTDRVKNFEKQEIIACLKQHKGHVQSCIEALGLPRKTFYDKLKKYDLNRADYQ